MVRLAERLKITPHRLSLNYTISNLIPQLGQLLNDKVLTQRTAYQLGQLPESRPCVRRFKVRYETLFLLREMLNPSAGGRI
jgi:hypothetical protein